MSCRFLVDNNANRSHTLLMTNTNTTFAIAKLDNGKYRATRGDGFTLGEFDTQRLAVGACSACADIDGDVEITIRIVRRVQVDTASIESLRSFAFNAWMGFDYDVNGLTAERHLSAFVHMCTAALNGEKWAVERIRGTLEMLADYAVCRATEVDTTLEAIRATDTTRPDGTIARAIEAP